ncbi:hypothetical protein OG21DRAFT_1175113 [Imleria badia]|nr:hypothetical protein OG21DRAFT_1175113 [Imleria badia]
MAHYLFNFHDAFSILIIQLSRLIFLCRWHEIRVIVANLNVTFHHARGITLNLGYFFSYLFSFFSLRYLNVFLVDLLGQAVLSTAMYFPSISGSFLFLLCGSANWC